MPEEQLKKEIKEYDIFYSKFYKQDFEVRYFPNCLQFRSQKIVGEEDKDDMVQTCYDFITFFNGALSRIIIKNETKGTEEIKEGYAVEGNNRIVIANQLTDEYTFPNQNDILFDLVRKADNNITWKNLISIRSNEPIPNLDQILMYQERAYGYIAQQEKEANVEETEENQEKIKEQAELVRKSDELKTYYNQVKEELVSIELLVKNLIGEAPIKYSENRLPKIDKLDRNKDALFATSKTINMMPSCPKYIELQKVLNLKKKGLDNSLNSLNAYQKKVKETHEKTEQNLPKILEYRKKTSLTTFKKEGLADELRFNCYHPSLYSTAINKQIGFTISFDNYEKDFNKAIDSRVIEYELGFIHLNECKLIRKQIIGENTKLLDNQVDRFSFLFLNEYLDRLNNIYFYKKLESMYESNLNESNNNSSDWLLLFKKKIGYNYFIRVRIVETKETTDDLQEEKSRDDMENELDGSSVLNNAEDDFHDLMVRHFYDIKKLENYSLQLERVGYTKNGKE